MQILFRETVVPPNAHAHCELVAARALELCKLNKLAPEDTALLENLSRVHDIGKIKGNARPEESVKLLETYGNFSNEFIALVWFLEQVRERSLLSEELILD